MESFDILIKRSYAATRKRGKITDSTTDKEFIDKMSEELREIKYAHKLKFKQGVISETVDLIAVGINFLTHKGIDFEKEFEECIKYQETRKD